MNWYKQSVKQMPFAEALRIFSFQPNDRPSFEQIKQRRNELANKYHPDRNPMGLEMMANVNNAYEVLTQSPTSPQHIVDTGLGVPEWQTDLRSSYNKVGEDATNLNFAKKTIWEKAKELGDVKEVTFWAFDGNSLRGVFSAYANEQVFGYAGEVMEIWNSKGGNPTEAVLASIPGSKTVQIIRLKGRDVSNDNMFLEHESFNDNPGNDKSFNQKLRKIVQDKSLDVTAGNWYSLLKFADYEQWRAQIEDLASQNPYPFSSWFDQNGRTYVPFASETAENFDEDVKDILDEVGCQITDYRGGYCQRGKNTFRIGKILGQEKDRALKEIQRKYQAGEIYNLERETQETTRYYDDIINLFVNSPFRIQKAENQFMIAISQNPQDMAMMSTDRNWESCMTLGEGSHHEDVFCEVTSGGLVAYLIQANDVDIQNPLARVHIRRFTNRQQQSIAIPEASVYGNEIAGFVDGVKSWLTERQGDVTPGMYQRQGGSYSDTFQDEMLVAPSKQKDVIKWFRGEDADAQYRTWVVEDDMYEDLKEYHEDIGYSQDTPENLTQEFNTKEEAERYLEIAETSEATDYYRESLAEYTDWNESNEETGEWESPRLSLHEKKTDNRSEMKSEAAAKIIDAPKGTYPPEILEQVKSYALRRSVPLSKSFIKKFPELLTQDEIKMLDVERSLDFVMSLPPEQQTQHKLQWQDVIINDIDALLGQEISNKDERGYDLHPDSAQYQARSSFKKQVTDPIEVLFKKQIPEPIIQKLIQYANSLEQMGYASSQSLDKPDPVGRRQGTDHTTNIRAHIVHILSIANADTPSVQQFYESLLPLWDDSLKGLDNYSVIGVSILGQAIAKLGENGRQFIPFMREKLQKAEIERQESADNPVRWQRITALWDKHIERLLYIIDALESGTGKSKKYKFFKSNIRIKTGSNWYKKAQDIPDDICERVLEEFGEAEDELV